MDPTRYRAFITYSHRDARWGRWLHKSLESYHPPKKLVGTTTACGVVPKRLSPVFRDREELPSATDLSAVINDALQQSACQIVICSPHAARSKWVNKEILTFKRLGREHRILCLIVSGEPKASEQPGREEEECFPPALRFRLGPDGNLSETRTEPLAADVREGKDGKRRAKLKLIAGVLGVGFDLLQRREQQRFNRRLLLTACAGLSGMVLTSGLAAYALVQRAAAQKHAARAQREAEAAEQTTRFLVDLFSISDPSEARGNSVTAREMLDKGAARIDSDLATQPVIQARLMDTLGSAYKGLGLYGQARSLLDGAVTRRRSQTHDDPLLLSDSLNHLGDLLTRQAELDAAEHVYGEALRVESARPGDPAARIQLANSLYGYGIVLARQGRYAEAQKNLRAALARQEALFGAVHPDTARTLKDLAQAIADGGDPNGALPLMERALAMQRQLRHNEPHPDLAEAINDLALLNEQRGDYDKAQELFREALTMKQRLFGEKHPEIANALENLANAFADKGDLEGADPLYRQALAMWRALLGDTHPEVAMALNNIASLQYDRGNIREGLATQREALAIFRKVYPHDHPTVALALNQLGFWLTMSGDYAEAGRDVEEALAMRRRLLGDRHPDTGSSQIVLATLQLAQGRYSGALESAGTALAIYKEALSPTHWRTAIAMSAQGAALTGLGRYAEAEPLLAQCEAILARDGGAPPVFRRLNEHYLDTLHRSERDASRRTSVVQRVSQEQDAKSSR